jgi:ATP-binding cassette, subfamily B, bacterial
MRRYKAHLFCAVFFLHVAALITLIIPIAVRRMIDHGFTAQDSSLINSYFTILCVCAAVLACASAGRYYYVITLGERMICDIRRDIFNHLMTLSPRFFDQEHSGEIISRLAADTTQIKSTLCVSLSIAFRNLILGVGALVMMVITSIKLAGLVILAIPFIVLPIAYFGRSVQQKTRTAQEKLSYAMRYAAEAIVGVRVVQSFTNEEQVRARFNAEIDSVLFSSQSSTKSRALLTGCAIFIIFTSIVAILWFGAHNVINNTMSAGTLSQFLLYSVFAAGALGALSEVWSDLSHASGSAQRLMDLLTVQPEITSPQEPIALPKPPMGTIRFENVTFAYPSHPDKIIVNNFSLNIKSGETVAIVGASGSGKSTIFSLLMRFYDPQQGIIYNDDVNIKHADLKEYRQNLGVVPQDTMIFAGSVVDNIGFGNPHASREQREAAAQHAHAHEFIMQLPHGYESLLGERGVMLSGGQRQRIAISRALLKNAPILLLDEATSALDSESEMLVQSAFDRLRHGRTTLIIAHRLSTILKADRIIVMEKGQIVEEGTHQELLLNKGVYARFVELQFNKSEQKLT